MDKPINYTTANTKEDLEAILALQKANLATNLRADEVKSQGFVTVDHSFEQLLALNNYEKHVIAKQGEKVVGYLLAMTEQSKEDIPELVSMFKEFNKTVYKEQLVSSYSYIVVGQVCIDKNFRGQGVLDNCYAAYKQQFSSKYQFAITEIAKNNPRSLKAHQRIGFKEIKTFVSPGNIDWVIVLWDWNNEK